MNKSLSDLRNRQQTQLEQLIEDHQREGEARQERLNDFTHPTPDRLSLLAGNPAHAAQERILADQQTEGGAKRKEERRKVLESTDSIEDVRNEEIREWLQLTGLFAYESGRWSVVKGTGETLLAELKRTKKLEAEYLAESNDPAVVGKWKEEYQKNAGDPVNIRSSVTWEWSRRGLFGAPKVGGISTNPIFQRKARGLGGMVGAVLGGDGWELTQGLIVNESLFKAEGWEPLDVVPDFSRRRDILLNLLDTAYRAGDIPEEVTREREKLTDLLLQRSDLVENAKGLIRRANIAPSRYAAEVAKFRTEREALERAIHEQQTVLQRLGADWRSL